MGGALLPAGRTAGFPCLFFQLFLIASPFLLDAFVLGGPGSVFGLGLELRAELAEEEGALGAGHAESVRMGVGVDVVVLELILA